LYDYVNNLVFTFKNIGQQGQIKYEYAPELAKNFPQLSSYLILKDYNQDGIVDLFHKGQFGVRVFKGKYVNNILDFVFYKDLFFPLQSGPANVYVQNGDIPAILDYDKDGDLDILSFDVFGTVCNYYKNMQVETFSPSDSMIMSLHTNCWGKFTQSFLRTVNLNQNCKGFAPNGITLLEDDTLINDIDITANPNNSKQKVRHSGNNIVLLDADGDNDFDMFAGSISYNDVQALYNQNNIIIAQDTQVAFNGNFVYSPSFPAPMHADIDNDGDGDFIVGSHVERYINLYGESDKLLLYKNISTTPTPNFVLQTNQLFFDDIIDIGMFSYPTFFDFDKDGKKDLFIGGEGNLDTSTFTLNPRMVYYKNTSTLNNISFELVSNDFLNLSAKPYIGLYPHFADIDGDKITDLIMGNNYGTIIVYKNTATSDSIAPSFVWLTDSFANIQLPNYGAPCMYDANNDGRKDLIIGDAYGKLHCYIDSSNIPGTTDFKFNTDNWGNVTAGGQVYAYGYAAPYVGGIDNTNRPQLIIGTGDGTIERYDSLKQTSFLKLDSLYSYIKTNIRAVAAAADLDNDGRWEMVVGNKLGGLKLYEQQILFAVDSTIDTTANGTINIKPIIKQNIFKVIPNPSNGKFEIVQSILQEPYSVTIYNILGEIIFTEKNITAKSKQIDITTVANNIYTYKIISKNYTGYGQIIKK
jgi:Secretion system C-terminal sorting domain/FG-GAP-like repeat